MKFFDGRIFGHPVHMMLVHFPAALLPVAVVLDVLQRAEAIQPIDILVLLIPGVALGWLAALFGFWDLVRIKSGTRAMTKALTHGTINATALSGFTWALVEHEKGPVSNWMLGVEIASALLILVGNKFGGDLVIRYFIGTNFEKPFNSEPKHSTTPDPSSRTAGL